MRRLAFVLLVVLAASVIGCGAAGHAPRQPWPAALGSAGNGPPDPRVEAVLGFAGAQVGKRYCWGGTGPDCFDCSGLVQAAWRRAGVRLPRTSTDQARRLAEVRLADIQPGDVMWWPHHVGLYVGNGEMIDAYHSRAGVVRRPATIPERVLRVE